MISKKSIAKGLITLLLTSSLLAFTEDFTDLTLVANAQEPQATSVAFDESFIPFRSFIPKYLSINSSVKSNTIKGLWLKLFDEQKANPNWSQKYYIDSSCDYIGLGAQRESFKDMDFARATGDFDAFLGNTIEANPEFLLELISSPEYNWIIQNKLANPSSYSYFAKAMSNLTKNYNYIGHDKDSDDNILKKYSYGSQTFDIWMLTSLAYLYEGDRSETYLSNEQVEWLKSYQRWLYEDYVTNGENSLAKKYPSIYELIARSSDAANNYLGKGQEFFDYVIATKKGAGAWLNLNDEIDIQGLDEIDDLASLFNTSAGWCGGERNDCRDHDACTEKAKKVDILAMKLHENPKAMEYISNNESVYAIHGESEKEQNTWFFRYHVKHSDAGIPIPTIPGLVNVIAGGNRATAISSIDQYRGTCDGVQCANASTTARIYLKDLLYDETVRPNGAKNPQNITWSYSGNNAYYYSANGGYDSYSTAKVPEVSVSDTSITYERLKDKKGNYINSFKFNLTNLRTEEQLKNAYIQITAYDGSFCNSRGWEGGPGNWSTYFSCSAQVTFGNPVIEDKADDCDITEHVFNDASIQWNDDYTSATITYSCEKNPIHHKDVQTTTKITSETVDGMIIYTAVDDRENTYTEKVPIEGSAGKGYVTIQLTPQNCTNNYRSITSSEVIVPGGAQSDMRPPRYTASKASIDGVINKNIIPLGAKKIEFSYVASEYLEQLKINIHSESGKIIGQAFVPSGSGSGKVTAILFANSDANIRNSYVTFTGSASTIHHRNDYWYAGQPAPSTATIGITEMKVYY
jgi:hypothetical protein